MLPNPWYATLPPCRVLPIRVYIVACGTRVPDPTAPALIVRVLQLRSLCVLAAIPQHPRRVDTQLPLIFWRTTVDLPRAAAPILAATFLENLYTKQKDIFSR